MGAYLTVGEGQVCGRNRQRAAKNHHCERFKNYSFYEHIPRQIEKYLFNVAAVEMQQGVQCTKTELKMTRSRIYRTLAPTI